MAHARASRWPLLLGHPALTPDDAEALLHRLFDERPDLACAVRLWDGRTVAFSSSPKVTLVINSADVFRRCFSSHDPAAFAEAYADSGLDVIGDIRDAVDLIFALREVHVGLTGRLALAAHLGVRPTRHSVLEDTRDVRSHYDLSNEFFELFLDERLVYSCAYFARPDQSLEEAQARKLDLVCRKLQLTSADTLLDLGCGWGALAMWAAAHYGCRVLGLTLSVNQATEAHRRIAEAGLADRVTVEIRHYQDLEPEAFDKVASIGMYEHVGLDHLAAYAKAVYGTLKPGGLFLNHGITMPTSAEDRTGGAFIFREVFPGAGISAVPHLQALFEERGFEIVDVQSLRPHYAMTLREWHRRFTEHRGRARELVPERILRVWDVYLAGCATSFRLGLINLHQVLVSKPEADGATHVPLTRDNLERHLGV